MIMMYPDVLKKYYRGVLKCLLYWYRQLCGSLLAGRVKLMKLMFLTVYQPIDEDLVLRHAPSRLDFEILYRGPFSKTVSDVIQELVGRYLDEQFIEVGHEHPLHIYDLENINDEIRDEGKSELRKVFEDSLKGELVEHVLRTYSGISSEQADNIVNKLLTRFVDLIDERARAVVMLYGDKEATRLERASLRLIGIKPDDKAKYLRMNVEDVMRAVGKQVISSEVIVTSGLYIRKVLQKLDRLFSM